MTKDVVLIEVLDGRERVVSRDRFRLGQDKRTLTIGRSVEADITLDDEHIAPQHAFLDFADNGQVFASDLGSVNGLIIAGQRLHGASHIPLPSNQLQIGRTRLRIRTSGEDLAPEKADHARPVSRWHDPAWLAGAGAVWVATQTGYETWLEAPRDLTTSLVGAVAMTAAVIALWVAIWALLSRIMQGEWRWLRHAAIILGAAAILAIADGILDVGWFALSLPLASTKSTMLSLIALATALWLHLVHASSLTSARAASIAAFAVLTLTATSYWAFERPSWRDVNKIDSAFRMYPPAFRLTRADDVSNYLKDVAALRAAADQKLKALIEDDPDPDESPSAAGL
jgi:pSer/pThr/pTyr-binding forkhead associated (FHA) protein